MSNAWLPLPDEEPPPEVMDAFRIVHLWCLETAYDKAKNLDEFGAFCIQLKNGKASPPHWTDFIWRR